MLSTSLSGFSFLSGSFFYIFSFLSPLPTKSRTPDVSQVSASFHGRCCYISGKSKIEKEMMDGFLIYYSTFSWRCPSLPDYLSS